MGLSMEGISDVEEVIIRSSRKEIIVENPEVTVLDLHGQKIFQVTGQVTEKKIEKEIEIPDEDVKLVADQTGRSMEEARKALEETDGDLARAILLLQAKS